MEKGAKAAVLAATATQFGGLMSLAEAAQKGGKADAIYLNGNVYTVNEAQKQAEAFAVKDGKFLAVGTSKEMSAFKGANTQTIDLQGQFVMPSLIDEHIHPDMGLIII